MHCPGLQDVAILQLICCPPACCVFTWKNKPSYFSSLALRYTYMHPPSIDLVSEGPTQFATLSRELHALRQWTKSMSIAFRRQ
jgi:hypothetical protein